MISYIQFNWSNRNIPHQLSSHPIFSGVHVAQSLFLCLVFCRTLFFRLSLFFWTCIVYPSSVYGFWLTLWYLQHFLAINRSLQLNKTRHQNRHLSNYKSFQKHAVYTKLDIYVFIIWTLNKKKDKQCLVIVLTSMLSLK